MDKYKYTFVRIVDPGFEEGDFDVKQKGARTFRIKTGDDRDFFSRKKTSRRDRFNDVFIKTFNESTGHNLDPSNIYVKRELRRIHEGLESGHDKIEFEVTRRML